MHNCSTASGANCTDHLNYVTCSCPSGTTGTGYIDSPCTDVTCDGNTCPQAPYATCYDITGGTYGCQCAAGLRDVNGDGRTCVAINECTDGTAICTSSSKGGICTDTLFGYSCSCRAGFTGNGTGINGCIDIPECTLGTHKCIGPGAACIELPGSYNCNCSTGWSGSSLEPSECRDVNECVVSPQVCSSVAHTSCTNRNGSYSCDCTSGYRKGLTGNCTDINECTELQLPCGSSSNTICTNLNGGYKCTCPSGYTGNQTDVVPNRHAIVCTDINECLAVPCRGSGSNCTNLIGSYKCGCSRGYLGNGTSSSPCHLPCDDQPCQSHATCTNDVTTSPKYYTCQCNDGYILNANGVCVDDRCSWATQRNATLCYGTNAICTSKPNTNYTCSCGTGSISGTGYSGSPCVPAQWPPQLDAAVTTFIVPVQDNGQLAPYIEVRVVSSMGMGAQMSSVSLPSLMAGSITDFGMSAFPSTCTSTEYCSQTAKLQLAVNGCQLNKTAVTFDWLSYCATISCPWQSHHYQTFLFSSSNGCPTTIDSTSVIKALTTTLYYRKNATSSNYAPVFPQPVFTLDDTISLVIKVVSIAPISALGLVQLSSRSSSTSAIYLVTDSEVQYDGITVKPVASSNIVIVNIPARVLFQNGLAAQTSGIFVMSAVVSLGYRIGETTVQSLHHVEQSLTHSELDERLSVQARNNNDNGGSIVAMEATTSKYATALLQVGTGLSSTLTYTVYISYTSEPTIGTSFTNAIASLLGVSTSRFSDIKIVDGQLSITIGTPTAGSGEPSTPELLANLQVYLSRRVETKSVAALSMLNDMSKLESSCLAASGSCETVITTTNNDTSSESISTLAVILIACAGLILLVTSVVLLIARRRYRWCQAAAVKEEPVPIPQPVDGGDDVFSDDQIIDDASIRDAHELASPTQIGVEMTPIPTPAGVTASGTFVAVQP
jgi:hypothetical protein